MNAAPIPEDPQTGRAFLGDCSLAIGEQSLEIPAISFDLLTGYGLEVTPPLTGNCGDPLRFSGV